MRCPMWLIFFVACVQQGEPVEVAWDVCADGGAAWGDLDEAAREAEDGATLRVCAGTYGPVTVSRKALTLVGEGPDVTFVEGGLGTALGAADATLEVSGFTFRGSASQELGALQFSDSTVRLHDARLEGVGRSGDNGSAAVVSGGDVTIDGVVFEGIDVPAFVIKADRRAALTVLHSVFHGNDSPVLGTNASAEITFTNNLVYDNTADFGGQVGGVIANNVFFGNPVGAETLAEGSIFANNVVLEAGDTSALGGAVSYNVAWDPAAAVEVSAGDLVADPLLVDPAGEDFRLQAGSPCVDGGDPDPAWNDPDGSRNDVGAFGGPNGAW